MSSLAERALRDCVEALADGDRQRAYAVILRDQYIDEKEKEIDRLCLEFLVRQQPVGLHLRLAYSTIKINLELERVGDYAESVARQILRLSDLPAPPETIRERIRRDGRPRHPDAARLDRGLRPAGPRARQEGHPDRAGGRRPARQAQHRRGRGAARAEDPARDDRRRSSPSAGASSGWPTRPATCAWRRSTCARASTPSTPGPRPSACCSSASTTPAAARWRRRSRNRSASPSSSSRAPASTPGPIDPRHARVPEGEGLRRQPHGPEGDLPGAEPRPLPGDRGGGPGGAAGLPAQPPQDGLHRLEHRRSVARPRLAGGGALGLRGRLHASSPATCATSSVPCWVFASTSP